MCETLWCEEINGERVTTQGDPPADGTSCGTNKVSPDYVRLWPGA